MKTSVALLIVLATSFASVFRPRVIPHDLTEADRARIEDEVGAFLASYLEVIEAGEAEAIRGLYVDDERFAWFTDGELRYTSADEVLASLASMEGMTFSTEASDVEVLPLTLLLGK